MPRRTPLADKIAKGALVASFAFAGGTAVVSSALRNANRGINATFPNEIPDPATVIQLHAHSRLEGDEATRLLELNGCSYNPNVGASYPDSYWRSWHGLYLDAIWPFDISDAWELYVRGFADADDRDTILKYSGDKKLKTVSFVDSFYAYPHAADAIALYRRGEITEKTAKEYIKRADAYKDEDIDHIWTLRNDIPGPSDLVRFEVREGWNDALAKSLGYDDEFPANGPFVAFMEAQGLRNVQVTTPSGLNASADWPKLYWRAHWQTMSPTQSYDAFHRLRPHRLWRYNAGGLPLSPFTGQELSSVLKAADYPLKQRGWLTAIAYKTIGRIDLRRAFFAGVVNEQEVYEQFLDQGYNQPDAQILLNWLIGEKKKWLKTPAGRNHTAEIRAMIRHMQEAYEIGSIDRSQFYGFLLGVKYDTQDANSLVVAIDTKVNNKHVKAYIKSIRTEYFTGKYDEIQAAANLIAAGINAERATRYVRLWEAENNSERKLLSTNTIKDWVTNGIISFAEGFQRLLVLGWDANDAGLWMDKIRSDIAKANLRLAMQNARGEERKARLAAAELRRQERESKDKVRGNAKQFPIASIKRWYIKGLISESEARGMLLLIGQDVRSIELYIAEWTLEKEAKRNAKEGQAGPS